MPTIETESSSCLVRLYSRSECRRCQEVCPASAITVDAGGVQVDHAACLGCGLCISACPTSVFSVRGLDLAAFLEAAVGEGGDVLTLNCACTSAADGVASDSARVLPCLGMLDDDLVLAFAGKGVRKLVLQAGDPRQCVLHADGLIAGTISRVQERWPGRLDIEIVQEQLVPDDPAFASVLDDLTVRHVDRREFLRGVVARAREVVKETPPAKERAWGPRPFPTRIPASREVLLASLGDGDPVNFARIAIGDSCDDCQDAHSLCARFCPSGALHRVEGEASVEFVFQPEICVDCGQCWSVCPRDAISRQGEDPSRGAIVLKAFQKDSCARCGRVSTNLADKLCPACSRDQGLKNMLVKWVCESE
jgi:Fe-S-cluster-containing hydrogenase component 2